jgi:hypothetical protein
LTTLFVTAFPLEIMTACRYCVIESLVYLSWFF